MGRFSCKTAARPRAAARRRLGSPLQQDMCYWLEEREIRVEKGARSLSPSLFRALFASPPPSLGFSSSFIRFLVLFPRVPARFLPSIWLYFHQRGREIEGGGSGQPITRVCDRQRAAFLFLFSCFQQSAQGI